MPLRDILQKKDKIGDNSAQYSAGVPSTTLSPVPDITFVRSDTTTHEVIRPPIYEGDRDVDQRHAAYLDPSRPSSSSHRRSLNPFSRSRSPSESQGSSSPSRARGERRLSHLLHRDRRNSSANSVNVPADLPQITDDKGNEQDTEAQWEKRATMLVQRNPQFAGPLSPTSSAGFGPTSPMSRSRSSSHSGVMDREGDVSAIRSS
ncbi:hypothetical protein P170DRAFT_152515 [Aspergillus steynii IBT 23096]|uniref:Uncharacterized protein n=1 Tax=Aspergillus steynii IBT 23096 TaxID=1392250 RepID=A0A2I2GCX0_9EURO|nr:uncharacterized protein P170DRAFT_152515 [Aspergillus steynii IBT 23096]PLB50729.1 hypothetical protein P170DRAFT_152515 [Aspergillus steynii IBT 23096]